MKKITFLTNGKYIAMFAQGKVNGRMARYIRYYTLTYQLISSKKVSLDSGNSAYNKLIATGWKTFKREVA